MIALYSRVSTAEQAKEGYSIGEQQKRLVAYCQSRGWKNYKQFTDPGYSGGNMKRPALQEMVKAIKDGNVNKVIVYKLDRLSRSQKDTLELLEDIFLPNGVDFISMCENFDTGSAFGKAMVGMFSVFAQLEREQIKERTNLGREARAKEGKWHGSGVAPIGYDYINGELQVNEFESMVIREAYKLYDKGHTYAEIAKILNSQGMCHRYGKWSLQAVSRIFKNPLYAGYVSFNGKEYPGCHEAIIDPETFHEIYEKVMSRHQYHRTPVNDAYLTGKLWCARCGARYTHTSSQTRNGTRISYYSCYSRAKVNNGLIRDPLCKNKIHRCDAFDRLILDELRQLQPGDVKKYRKSIEQTDTAAPLQKELAKLEKQRSKLIDLYSVGDFSVEELRSKIEPINLRKQAIEAQLKNTGKELRSLAEIESTIDSIDSIITSGDRVAIRHLIDLLIDHIDIDGDDITIFWDFD